jgi:hypothetical protein
MKILKALGKKSDEVLCTREINKIAVEINF